MILDLSRCTSVLRRMTVVTRIKDLATEHAPLIKARQEHTTLSVKTNLLNLICTIVSKFSDCVDDSKGMVQFYPEYITSGGNRHPSAADWDHSSGILAYGADRNLALWSPLVL